MQRKCRRRLSVCLFWCFLCFYLWTSDFLCLSAWMCIFSSACVCERALISELIALSHHMLIIVSVPQTAFFFARWFSAASSHQNHVTISPDLCYFFISMFTLTLYTFPLLLLRVKSFWTPAICETLWKTPHFLRNLAFIATELLLNWSLWQSQKSSMQFNDYTVLSILWLHIMYMCKTIILYLHTCKLLLVAIHDIINCFLRKTK